MARHRKQPRHPLIDPHLPIGKMIASVGNGAVSSTRLMFRNSDPDREWLNIGLKKKSWFNLHFHRANQ